MSDTQNSPPTHPGSFDEFLKTLGPDHEPVESREDPDGYVPEEAAPAASPESGTDTTSPETAQAGEATAQATAAAASAAARRVLKLKEDGAETDFDLDDYYETKRDELAALLQKGRMHERIVERRERASKDEASSWFLERARKGGFTLAYDESNDTLIAIPVNGSAAPTSAAANGNGATKAPEAAAGPEDVDQILKRLEQLDEAISDGDAAAIAEANKLNRRIAQIQRAEADQLRNWKRTQEEQAAKAAQAAQTATIVQRVEAFKAANQKAFEGYSDAEFATLVRGYVAQSQTPEDLLGHLQNFAASEMQRRQKWIASLAQPNGSAPSQRTAPAPAAPPVHNGASPTAGGGSQRPRAKSTYDADWWKSL